MQHNHQLPLTDAEHIFTFAEPEIDTTEYLEAKLIADELGITFICRDCLQLKDIECGLGCRCLMCEDCAMQYVGD